MASVATTKVVSLATPTLSPDGKTLSPQVETPNPLLPDGGDIGFGDGGGVTTKRGTSRGWDCPCPAVVAGVPRRLPRPAARGSGGDPKRPPCGGTRSTAGDAGLGRLGRPPPALPAGLAIGRWTCLRDRGRAVVVLAWEPGFIRLAVQSSAGRPAVWTRRWRARPAASEVARACVDLGWRAVAAEEVAQISVRVSPSGAGGQGGDGSVRRGGRRWRCRGPRRAAAGGVVPERPARL